MQQPLVFSSAGGTAVRNDQTGALTAVQGSPFAPSTNTAFTLDVQGRYLFSLGANSIHMFQITDATTGAYSEVCGSPFASPTTKTPLFLAVEPTGQFLAVVDNQGTNPGEASVETFAITPSANVSCPGVATGPVLIPVAGSATELDSTPVGMAQPPNNQNFLIFLGANPSSPNPVLQQGSEFQALAIDPATGFLTGLQSGTAVQQRGMSFAMDPQGRYYVTGTRDNLLETGSIQISGLNGSLTTSNVDLPTGNQPAALWIDSTGSFLYAAISAPAAPTIVQIYSVNLQTSALSLMPTSPLPNFTNVPAYFADPTGSFDYGFGADENTAIAYSVDPLTGYFVATANSPFTIAQIGGSLTFSIPPGGQGVSGPSAQISATSLSFGSQQTGTSTTAQVVTLTSNGGEALSVTSIALSGADPTQFTESDTCQTPAVLQPTKFCSISVAFAPTNTGAQQANLVITDNAPGSPQIVPLGGSGAAPPPPAPAVAISPNPLNFATITEGTASSPATISVKNTGNAALHITAEAVGGNNPGDFTIAASACVTTLNPQASCGITVTFAPLAPGQRTATITLTDDAADSPQTINIGGNANPAVSVGAAPGGSTSASVSAGQTAQYNLQVTPGAGYSGTVSLSCSGAPQAAMCQMPASVQVTNGNAATFTVSVSTTGSSSAVAFPGPLNLTRVRLLPVLVAAFVLLLLLKMAISVSSRSVVDRPLFTGQRLAANAVLAVAAAALLTVAGCGGGTVQVPPPPPPVITPAGNFSLTIAPSANAANGKALQLPAIQLTLTVK